jgi:hypothetical protein
VTLVGGTQIALDQGSRDGQAAIDPYRCSSDISGLAAREVGDGTGDTFGRAGAPNRNGGELLLAECGIS